MIPQGSVRARLQTRRQRQMSLHHIHGYDFEI